MIDSFSFNLPLPSSACNLTQVSVQGPPLFLIRINLLFERLLYDGELPPALIDKTNVHPTALQVSNRFNKSIILSCFLSQALPDVLLQHMCVWSVAWILTTTYLNVIVPLSSIILAVKVDIRRLILAMMLACCGGSRNFHFRLIDL